MSATTQKQLVLLSSKPVPRPGPKPERGNPAVYEAILQAAGWSMKDLHRPGERDDTPTPVVLPKQFHIQDILGRYLSVDRQVVRIGDYEVVLTYTLLVDTADGSTGFKAEPSGNSYIIKRVTPASSNDYIDLSFNEADGIQFLGFVVDGGAYPASPFDLVLSGGNKGVYIKYGKYWLSNDCFSGNSQPLFHNWVGKNSLFTISAAAVEFEIYDVEYDLENPEINPQPPVIALQAHVHNESPKITLHQVLQYSYSYSKVGTWNDKAGVSVGVETTIKTGVPFLAEGGVTVKVSASYEHSWGGSVTESEVVSETTTIDVPPLTSGVATVIVNKSKLRVKFTYKEKALWADGTQTNETKFGVYDNVDSFRVDVKLVPDQVPTKLEA